MRTKRIGIIVLLFLMLISAFPKRIIYAKSYKSFADVLAKYDERDSIDYDMYYNTIDLTTSFGRKKCLVLTLQNGQMSSSDLWYKDGNKAKKYCKVSGTIKIIANDRKWLVTRFYAGSGYGSYTYYEFNGSKYKKKCEKGYDSYGYDGEVITEDDALDSIEDEVGVDVSDSVEFDAYKHERGKAYEIKEKRFFVHSISKKCIKYYEMAVGKYGYVVGKKLKKMSLSKSAGFTKRAKSDIGYGTGSEISISINKMKKLIKKYRKKGKYMSAYANYKRIGKKKAVVKVMEAFDFTKID